MLELVQTMKRTIHTLGKPFIFSNNVQLVSMVINSSKYSIVVNRSGKGGTVTLIG